MRTIKLLLLLAAITAGCTQEDTNPHWNPRADLPSWTYDAPFYYRPSEDLKVIETVGQGIPVYYPRTKYFFIKHPGDCQVNGVPRVAVWASPENGTDWERAGFYGVEQSDFLFLAEREGTYWIRFVGPGQGVSKVPPGMPHRIYIADRTPPNVTVTVTPGPWEDDRQEKPHIYKVGDTVRLDWVVSDANLDEKRIKLGTCFAKFPQNVVWDSYPEALSPVGSLEAEIPAEAAEDGGLRFRIEARDKAGNVGMGLTEVLQIAGQVGTKLEVTAAGPDDPIQQFQGTDTRQPGWPTATALLRGGSERVLKWMPEKAKDYTDLALEFSANNAQTWRVVASDLAPGKPVKWTVPRATSLNCRLRITAADKSGRRIMLAMTQQFVVDTPVPDTVFGPKAIPLVDQHGQYENGDPKR